LCPLLIYIVAHSICFQAVDVQPHVRLVGAMMALTFRNLEQIAIEESFRVEKNNAASLEKR